MVIKSRNRQNIIYSISPFGMLLLPLHYHEKKRSKSLSSSATDHAEQRNSHEGDGYPS